jgi:ssDNA-binding Zn-finger/Zn-ribbon topoisomerase 1
MEARTKNRIMILIIVVCLTTASVIAYFSLPVRKQKWETIPENQKVWLLCRECELSWQTGKREFVRYLEEHQNPLLMEPAGVMCSGCGKERGYRAEKCGKCELIFGRGSVPHDFADRCPECGFSATEENRKNAHRARGEAGGSIGDE